MRTRLARALTPVAIAAGVAACSAPAAAADPTGPRRSESWAARIVAPVTLRARPAGRAIGTIGPLTQRGDRQQLMVLASRRDADGALWVRVQLPTRPNGDAGWVAGDDVALRRLRTRVEVQLAARRLVLRRDGRRVGAWRVVVGAPGTPTPRGTFAVHEVVRQPPGAELGPWTLHLTAHSEVLDDYGGGPGRVALHGRAGALLGDPLGSARSHGCVRMDDARVAALARRLAPGTPVVIR